MTKRMQYCFYCGQELGVYDNFGEPDHCGEPVCSREFRYMLQSEQLDAWIIRRLCSPRC
jgi:hypothetical protein